MNIKARMYGLSTVIAYNRSNTKERAMPSQTLLTPTDEELVDRMAEITNSTATDVVRSALEVYQWFVQQAITGGHVVARNSSGEEITLETAELAALGKTAARLNAKELGALAERLAVAKDPTEAGHIRDQLTRGFYGI